MIVTLVIPFLVATVQPIFATTKTDRPTQTEVVVHSIADFSEREKLNKAMYWGNGTEQGFTDAVKEYEKNTGLKTDWRPQTNNFFRALRLPDNAVVTKTDKDDKDLKPKISDAYIGWLEVNESESGEREHVKWSDVLKPVKVERNYGGTPTVGSNFDDKSNKINQWTIGYVHDNGDTELKLLIGLNRIIREATVDYWENKGLTQAEVIKISDPTDAEGNTKFKLANGQWIIEQALTENMDKSLISTFSVPMFISLPMMNPTAKNNADSNYWYDATGNNSLHLYAKQYDPTTIKVAKTNAEDGKPIKDVRFLMMRKDLFVNYFKGDVNAALEALDSAIKKIIADLKDHPDQTDQILDRYLKQYVGAAGNPLYAARKTDKNGIATFSSSGDEAIYNLDTCSNYYIAEIYAPEPYLIDSAATGDSVANYPNIHEIEIEKYYESDGNTILVGEGTTDFGDYDRPTVDKAVKVNGKTFGLNEKNTGDQSEGVARGQIFQWIINASINQNIGSYTKYELLDTIPYNSNWTDATLSLTYTDKNGKQQSISLFEMMQNLYPRNAEGVAAIEHASGEGIAYTNNQAGSTVNNLQIGYNQQTAPTVKAVNAELSGAEGIELAGRTSIYTFDSNNRTVDKKQPVEDGYAQLTLNAELRTWLSNKMTALLEEGAKNGSWHLNWTLDAFANTAAQSSDLVNTIDLSYQTTFDSGSDRDKTHTFTAGWEIVKTDGNPVLKQDVITNGLAGAGFNLGYQVTKDNLSTIVKALYSAAAYPTYSHTASDNDIAQLKVDVQAGKVRWVYFMHLDVETQMPMNMMHSGSHSVMGDVIWTLDEKNATTHTSGTDGYLQYCGLASGEYQLKEVITPEGYQTLKAPYNFTLTRQEKGIINGQAGDGDIFVANYKEGAQALLPKTAGVWMLGIILVAIVAFLLANAAKLKEKMQ